MSGKRHDLLVKRVDDPIRLREEALLKLESRSDPVSGTNNNCRTVKVIEAHLGDVGSHISHYGVTLASIANKDDLTGLLNRLDNLLVVERYNGTSVDDLCGYAILLLKNLCSVKSSVKNCAKSKNGNVLTLLLDVGLAEGDLEVTFGNAVLLELLTKAVNSLALQ